MVSKHRRLLQPSSLAASLSLYVPAVVAQKAIGLARGVVLTYLLARAQYGLLGVGMMLFHLAAPLVTLGSNNALVRYASHYELAGRLEAFVRRVRWAVPAVALTLTAAALAAAGPITRLLLATGEHLGAPADAAVAYRARLHVCVAALANALVMALYHNLLGLAMGLRLYRLVALLELAFSAVFTAVVVAVLAAEPTALAALAAHGAVLTGVLAVGTALLHAAVRQRRPVRKPPLSSGGPAGVGPADAGGFPRATSGSESMGPDMAAPALGGSPAEAAAPPAAGMLRRVFRFGTAMMVGNLLLLAATYVSFYLVHRRYGPAPAGVFAVFLTLAQPVLLLGNAAWTVLYTHVARRWEARKRRAALLSLQTGYKAVTLALLALAVLLRATAPLWVRVLDARYEAGLVLLPGLLLLFQTMSGLSLLTIIARLRERPAAIAAALLAGAAVNALLARAWMPAGRPWAGMEAAAWAGGVGLYAGGMAVAAAYLLLARVPLRPGTWLVLLSPAMLALPVGPAAAAIGALLLLAFATPLVFARPEKRLLRQFVVEAGRRARAARQRGS